MSEHPAYRWPIAALVAGLFLAVAGVGLAPSSARADETPHLRFTLARNHPDILIMSWQGEIKKPMSDEVAAAFEKNKEGLRGVEFRLDSGGGSVGEGERVIKILQDIKKSVRLYTSVGPGKKCGSMCVFIYLQGEKRLAAPASLWLFHEVSFKDKITGQITRLDRGRWEKLVEKYWIPAGVDPNWIETVKTHTMATDYWQSGESLLRDHANIITKALSDEHRRIVAGQPAPAPTATVQPVSTGGE